MSEYVQDFRPITRANPHPSLKYWMIPDFFKDKLFNFSFSYESMNCNHNFVFFLDKNEYNSFVLKLCFQSKKLLRVCRSRSHPNISIV